MVHVATKELHLVREVVVQTEVNGIVFERLGDASAKADGITNYGIGNYFGITDVGVVSSGHHVAELLNGWADADSARIAAQPAGRTAGSRRSKGILHVVESENAVSKSVGWDDAFHFNRLGEATNFIVSEEERLVFPERAAKREASAIVMLRLFLGERSSCVRVRSVAVVPGVGVQSGVLMEPIAGTMKSVGAALTDDVDLAAGGAAEASVVVGHANTELVGGFDANRNERDLVATTCDDVIRDVDTVEVEGILIAARAGDGAAGIAETASV